MITVDSSTMKIQIALTQSQLSHASCHLSPSPFTSPKAFKIFNYPKTNFAKNSTFFLQKQKENQKTKTKLFGVASSVKVGLCLWFGCIDCSRQQWGSSYHIFMFLIFIFFWGMGCTVWVLVLLLCSILLCLCTLSWVSQVIHLNYRSKNKKEKKGDNRGEWVVAKDGDGEEWICDI